jgi:hypothetical protein
LKKKLSFSVAMSTEISLIQGYPFTITYFPRLGTSYLLSGQYEEAIKVCKKVADSEGHARGAKRFITTDGFKIGAWVAIR